MPGIAGIVSVDGPTTLRSALNRMAQPLLRPPLLEWDSASGERAALAAVYLRESGSPLARRAGRGGAVWLACSGIVHFDDPAASNRPLAEELIDRYLAGGRAALCGLNGAYVIAIWEEPAGRLTLIKDRMGYSKLFYWHDGQRLMFASEYKAIAWHPAFSKEIDPVCVADIFLYRTPLEGRTLFRDIRSMPPAGVLTFQNGACQVETYWKIQHCPPGAPDRKDEEFADGLAEVMRAAVRRRIRPNTCLLITGGLDSRIIAGMYKSLDPSGGLVAATLGMPHGADVVVGRALAESLNIPHSHVPIGCDYLARWAAANVWRTEGKNGAYASWIAAQAPFMAGRGLTYALSGLFGNYISARHYPKESLAARTLEEGVAAVEGNLNPYLGQLKRILRPAVFQSAAQESAATLGMIFRRAETDSIIQRTDEFNFYFRVCRHANTEDSLGDVSQALETFLDNDVFDYAIGQIPPAARARALFYHLLILRHLPGAANVVIGNTGASVMQDYTICSTPLLRELHNYRCKIARRFFPGRGNGAHASIPHDDAIRSGSRRFVQKLIDQPACYEDLFDPAAVRAMLDDHLSGRASTFMMIDALVTFILWRKQFVQTGGPLAEEFAPEMEEAL